MTERKWRGAKQKVTSLSSGKDQTEKDRLHVFRDGKSLCREFEDVEDDGNSAIYTPFGWPGAKYCITCREINKVPEGQRGLSPYKMKPYGHDTGLNFPKPARYDHSRGTGYKTTLTERKRVKRKPRKAARQQAKKEIVKETSQ